MHTRPKARPTFSSDVAQHFEAQHRFLSSRKGIVRRFRTDSNKGCASGRYVRKNFLERLKLKIAIRTPAAAIECHNDRSALQKHSDVNCFALCIGEHDRRRAIAGFERSFRKAVAELVDLRCSTNFLTTKETGDD